MECIRMRSPYIWKNSTKLGPKNFRLSEFLNNSLKTAFCNFPILNSYSQMSFSRVRGCGPIHGTEMIMTHLLIDESILFEHMKNSD